jgi:hypothetical protein
MQAVVEARTDVAALAMGDVAAVDELLDAPNMDAWVQQRDRATSAARLWRAETGRDGSFLVHLFVNEQPQSQLAAYLTDPIAIARFPIPSGRVLVAGEECFARRQLDQLKLGSVVEIPPGEFSLIAYRTEYPDDLAERRLRETVSSEQVRAWSLGNALPAICAAWTLFSLLAAGLLYAVDSSMAVASIPVVLAVAAWFGQARFRQRAPYRAAQGLYQRYEREYPSVVIVLNSLVSSADP